MKQTSTLLKSITAAAVLLAGGAQAASAAGLIGQRYIEATYDHVFWDSDTPLEDGIGATLTLNHPLTDQVDLGISGSFLNADIENSSNSVKGRDILGYATFHNTSGATKPYLRVGLGWTRASTEGFSETDGFYLVEGGLEWAVGTSTTFTPFLRWSDAFETDTDGVFEYGVKGEVALSSKISAVAAVTGNDDSDWELSIGALLRF